ncbi:MAG: helix-turn-helix domain-containing protein [Christensenellales bacterium]|jgi:AraC-like DNA-binding protein
MRHSNPYVILSRDTYKLDPPVRCGGVSLVQLADITGHAGWQSGVHVQFCHEIVLMMAGSAEMRVNESVCTVHAGETMVIPESALHNARFVGEERSRMLLVGVHFQGESAIGSPNDAPRRFDYTLGEHFTALIDEYFQEPALMRAQMVECMLNALLIRFARLYSDGEPRAVQPEPPLDTEDKLVKEMYRYIALHALDIRSLDSLTDVFCYSYPYLSRQFHAKTGYTLREYWGHCRFQEVLRLMEDPSLSLTKIADIAHFQSIHAFSRAFSKRFGVSPSAYMARLDKQNP